jgi:hypothetical protein
MSSYHPFIHQGVPLFQRNQDCDVVIQVTVIGVQPIPPIPKWPPTYLSSLSLPYWRSSPLECLTTQVRRRSQGFLPQLDEYFFTTAGNKILENCKCIPPSLGGCVKKGGSVTHVQTQISSTPCTLCRARRVRHVVERYPPFSRTTCRSQSSLFFWMKSSGPHGLEMLPRSTGDGPRMV